MNVQIFSLQRAGVPTLAIIFGLGALVPSIHAQSQTCVLSAHHAGVTFPVEQVTPAWACRLQPIITSYTTANKVGPIRTPLPETLYRAVLDRPPMTATLVNRLGLAPYQAAMRGTDQFWGNDGEGAEGLVHLIYQDFFARIYYLEGDHVSRFLPRISGKAVILVRMNPIRESNGADAVDTTLVSYLRLDNRFLSGLLSLIRPFIGGSLTRRLVRAVEVANRLSQEMQQHPDSVVQAAVAAPSLPPGDIAFLKEAIATLHSPSDSDRKSIPAL
ncbi:MAG TPA: hypothetical protein VLE03_06535 [Nitrospiraceae bacterium]|nr:hypothetical protein [Nitrospiraceae bacterium]